MPEPPFIWRLVIIDLLLFCCIQGNNDALSFSFREKLEELCPGPPLKRCKHSRKAACSARGGPSEALCRVPQARRCGGFQRSCCFRGKVRGPHRGLSTLDLRIAHSLWGVCGEYLCPLSSLAPLGLPRLLPQLHWMSCEKGC